MFKLILIVLTRNVSVIVKWAQTNKEQRQPLQQTTDALTEWGMEVLFTANFCQKKMNICYLPI